MLRNVNQYTYLINRNLYTQKQVVFFLLKYLKMSIKTSIKCFEWHLSQGDRNIDLSCVFTKEVTGMDRKINRNMLKKQKRRIKKRSLVWPDVLEVILHRLQTPGTPQFCLSGEDSPDR